MYSPPYKEYSGHKDRKMKNGEYEKDAKKSEFSK